MKFIFALMLACFASALVAQASGGGNPGSGTGSAPPFIAVNVGVAVIPDGGIHLVTMNDTVSAESFNISITNAAAGQVTLTTTITNMGTTGILESDWEDTQQVPFNVNPTLGVFNTTGGVVHLVTILATNSTTSRTMSFSIVQDHPLLTVREGLNEIEHGASAAATGRDFGSQDVSAGPTVDLTVTILNTGNAPMVLGTPVVTGASTAEFVVTAPGVMTVPASNSTTFTIAFDPATAGSHVAMVEFTHNDSTTQNPFSFEVTGVGIPAAPAPIVVVRETDQNGSVISNGAAPAGIRDFGSVATSDMPTVMRLVHIKNEGTADLTLGMPSINGTGFTIDTSGLVTTLTPGSNCTIGLIFDTAVSGNHLAAVSFTHDDTTTTTPFTFEVSGYADDGIVSFRGGGGDSGCSSAQGSSIAWLLILLASAGLIYRRRLTA
ncbi:MAG: choice-of-anchor D domain-containing protein [Planctomycetota bacterium]